VYDCQTCGACCVHPASAVGGAYIHLTDDEERRMKRLSLSVIQKGGESFLGARPGPGSRPVCVAFAGRVGGWCGCSIYEDRPHICRQFEAGDALCLEARERAGLPV
jgi:Fe-S-cluster containining protein